MNYNPNMIQTYIWVITNKKGSVRTVKKNPTVKSDEVAFKLDIELPKAMFEKPKLSVSVKVPEDAVKEEIVSEEIIDNIGETLKRHMDMDINITVASKTS